MEEEGKAQKKLFGTDGIRGESGKYPLTDGMIYKIGRSVVKLLLHKNSPENKLTIIIGRDNRLSGKRIQLILTEAMSDYEANVISTGVIPTPGLAFLVKKLNADLGVMISGSHNQPKDNGLKFFNREGDKLSVEEQAWMEQLIFSSIISTNNGFRDRIKGKVINHRQAIIDYKGFLSSNLEGVDVSGFRVALDCASGATSGLARSFFEELGNQVYSIKDDLSDIAINSSGATKPRLLRNFVLENKLDVGFAFDGDGDRVVAIDEKGNILDGDNIMAIMAVYLSQKGRLSKNTIVSTVSSNHGLQLSLEKHGIKVVYSGVGDVYVSDTLKEKGLNFGGEQFGHIIFFDYSSTPDGLLTSLKILQVMKETGKPLSELAGCISKLPRISVNIKVKAKTPLHEIPLVWDALYQSNLRLKSRGRVLVRYSGTEDVIRVIVECWDRDLMQEVSSFLVDVIEREIGVGEKEYHSFA